MENRLATSQRETQIDQDGQYSKLKIMDVFVKGRQAILENFNTLIANLLVACMCLLKNQLNSGFNPLIEWFLTEMEAVVKKT